MQKSSWVGRLGRWAEGGFGVCCIAIPGTGGWNRQIRAPAQPVSGQGLGKSAMLALASPWDSSAWNHTSYWVTRGPGTHDVAQAARPSWGLSWEPAFCHFCHIPLVKTGPGPSTDLRGQGYPRTWILGRILLLGRASNWGYQFTQPPLLTSLSILATHMESTEQGLSDV